jgi:hypothetical protein
LPTGTKVPSPQKGIMTNVREEKLLMKFGNSKRTSRTFIDDAGQIKQMAQENIEQSKDMCVDVDRIEDSLIKQNMIADTLTKDVVESIPEEDWNHVKMQFEQAANTQKTMHNLRRDMETVRSHISAYRIVMNTFTSSNSTSGSSIQSVLSVHADRYPQVKQALDKVEFFPTWVDDIGFIRQALTKIMPSFLMSSTVLSLI